MRILVTGGAGFIGSNLVDALIDKGYEVVIVDNLVTGQKEFINPEAKFIHADIADFRKIEEIFKNENPEAVYHLAAQIDVRKSVEDPVFDAGTNIIASLNLINLSKKYKIKKFIFSSTGGAIYGDTELRPTNEEHPEWPLSPYGIAKLAIDKYLKYYHSVLGLDFVSLRYANVYGPRQNPHGEAGVVAIFLNKMLSDEQSFINGDGLQSRDYVFVDDVVEANVLASEDGVTGIYNIGTGIEIDVLTLFDEINNQFGNKFKRVHREGMIGEQKTSCLSYKKINKDLGWEPKVEFSDGIKSTFEWFSNR